MSTYYRADNTDTQGLDEQDYERRVDMDLEQMLFWLEEVFGEAEYKYCFGNERTYIVPMNGKEDEYQGLINHSNEIFEKNKILSVLKDHVKGFSSDDYLKICKYEIQEAKDRLYFLNVLTNRFNSTGKLGERENVIYFCLFDYQRGKEFIEYLLAVLLRLLVAYRDEGRAGVQYVIGRLNDDFDSMQQCYGSASIILTQLNVRCKKYQNYFKKDFFVNSIEKIVDWLESHQTIAGQEDVWEFIFEGACSQNYRSLAMNLLWHIVQISHFSLQEENVAVKWEDKLKSRAARQDFYYLDKLIKQLEESDANSLFERIDWVNNYMQRLDAVVYETSFSRIV